MNKIKHIVILTGAGISAESGVPTFRDANGLWCNHRIEEVASPQAFRRNPELVQRFYNERRRGLMQESVKPNAAHKALTKLQSSFPGSVSVVTQNVDNLHERAGTKDVLHMHGELLKVRCSLTDEVFPWTKDIDLDADECPCCGVARTLRPHIVWFGEMPLYMEKIGELLQQADLFVAVGTSGQVYPAAGFVEEVKAYGGRTLELNLDSGENNYVFDKSILGKATEVVPKWVDSMLDGSFK